MNSLESFNNLANLSILNLYKFSYPGGVLLDYSDCRRYHLSC